MDKSSETTRRRVFDPEVAADPRGAFRALRQDSPVLRLPEIDGLGEGGAVLLSRYEDVHFALKHPEIFSSDIAAVDIGQDRPLIPLQINPPDHAAYRRRLDPHFSPKAVTEMEQGVRDLANRLIDGFAGRGACDFHTEFAVPFPCTIFLDIMGLPADDLPRFLRWKDDIIRTPVDPSDGAAARGVRKATGREIYAYFDAVIEARTREPRDDLMTAFVTEEVDGCLLSREEILGTCFLFLLGGLDTVTASLDCIVAHLAQHQEEQRRIAQNPELIPGVVEELLRWETPVTGIPRLAVADVTIGDVEIKAGERVLLLLGSADTDEGEFERADEVDFVREHNRHLAFGGGPHRCLGSHLARRELRVALEEVHRRIPRYSLVPDVELVFSSGIRQLDSLPLVFEAERAL